MDYLAIGVHELANMSERRLERMMNPGEGGRGRGGGEGKSGEGGEVEGRDEGVIMRKGGVGGGGGKRRVEGGGMGRRGGGTGGVEKTKDGQRRIKDSGSHGSGSRERGCE